MRKIRLPHKAYNTGKLSDALRAQFGTSVLGISGVREGDGWLKDKDGNDVYEADVADDAPDIEALILALAERHSDAPTPEEAAEVKQTETLLGAKETARSVENWSSWSQSDFLTWHNTHISAEQIGAVTSLADARALLLQQSVAIEALGQIVIAMRNQLWPDLQG